MSRGEGMKATKGALLAKRKCDRNFGINTIKFVLNSLTGKSSFPSLKFYHTIELGF